MSKKSEYCASELWGLLVMVVFGFLQLMLVMEKHVMVVFLYVVTLWPFIHQVIIYGKHLDSGPGGTNKCFPLPPVA